MEDHVEKLCKVFKVSRDNALCIKREKCIFAQPTVQFLRHTISHGEIRIDGDKVEPIKICEAPTKVPELCFFLGLANYFRCFIFRYSAIAATLTDLLKKNREWEWSDPCQAAFERLKAAVMEEPFLALPYFPKVFEVHTDSSDFATGGDQMQEAHPIAFESKKQNDAERRYSAHEKEMKDFLVEFSFTFEYKPGKANVIADALTHKDAFAAIWANLRLMLIKDGPGTASVGNPGQKRTLALIEASYYWPWMWDDIEVYVRTCLICQQDKVETKVPGGLLEPLPIAKKPWDSVTMDFITCLPNSKRIGNIMVVVDRFSKYARFNARTASCKAKEEARIFLRDVIKYWGIPKHVIKDRDPQFALSFWRELFSRLGSELHFLTSFNPQTDGQTERINVLLECYLRHYVSDVMGRSPLELATVRRPNPPQSLPVDAGLNSPGAYHMAKA
nr:uncharacterized protein LOC109119103 [Solanum lycopersicum]